MEKNIYNKMDVRIKSAIDLIHKNYEIKILSKELWRKCSLSNSRFCELFKSETKSTFKKYLKEYRLNEAKKLLGENLLSIKQIAYEAGYKSVPTFSNDFRNKFGKSPKA